MKLTRRHSLQGAAAALVSAGGVGFYAWRIEPHWVQWVRRILPVEHLPSDL